MLVDLLGRRPDEAIRREIGPQPRERLPCQQDSAVGGLIEICPEEGRLVSGNLGRIHKPLGNLVEVEPGDRRVSVRRDEMNMRHLSIVSCISNSSRYIVIDACSSAFEMREHLQGPEGRCGWDLVAPCWVLSALWRLDSCSFRHAKCAAGKAQIWAGTMVADPMSAAREERRWIWR